MEMIGRMFWIGLWTALAIHASNTAGQQPQENLPTMNAQLSLRVEGEDEYVLGLPMPVAATLGGVQPGTVLGLLPEPTLFGLSGCIGVTLRERASGKQVLDEVPEGVFDLEHHPPKLALAHGEQRRYLIDLSEVIPATLAPGTYTLTLTYVAPKFSVQSPAAVLVVRAASDDESRWLAPHQADVEDAGSWGQWVLEPPADPDRVPALAETPALARFYVAFRYLAHTSTPLDQIDPRPLGTIQGITRPEALVLGLDLLAARQSVQRVQQIRSMIRTQTPALMWRIERAERGAGMLAGVRFD
jgi:hypothetical protein